jgi:hypothetical protein
VVRRDAVSQCLSQRTDDVEWNGDSPGQTEVELAGRELVDSYRVERIIRSTCGFQVLLKVIDTRGKALGKLKWNEDVSGPLTPDMGE